MNEEGKVIDLKQKIEGSEREKQALANTAGRLTARQRIEKLLDEKSFVETDMLYNRGIISGYGAVLGRPVCVYSVDVTEDNMALTTGNIEKIIKIYDIAVKTGVPIVAFIDSQGIKLDENVKIMKAIGQIIEKQVNNSGVIPQIAVVVGECIGGLSYLVASNDFVFTLDEKSKVITSLPKGLKLDTTMSEAEIGGDNFMSEQIGLSDFRAKTEEELIANVAKLLSYLPDNNLTDAVIEDADNLNKMIEDFQNISLDGIKGLDIISKIADYNEIFEIKSQYGISVTTAFVRVGGRVVGMIASNESLLNGKSFAKTARFVRFCDAFNIPVVTLVNVCGHESSLKEENAGIMREGAKLLYAYAEATVPKITIILKNSFGSAGIAMGGINSDVILAWPNTQIGIANNEVMSDVILDSGDKKSKLKEYENMQEGLRQALDIGYITDVIEPCETRQKIISALEFFITKRENRPVKKHGNIEL